MNEAHRISKRMKRVAKLQARITEAEARRDRAKKNGEFTLANQIHEREVRPAQATYHAALSSAVEMKKEAA